MADEIYSAFDVMHYGEVDPNSVLSEQSEIILTNKWTQLKYAEQNCMIHAYAKAYCNAEAIGGGQAAKRKLRDAIEYYDAREELNKAKKWFEIKLAENNNIVHRCAKAYCGSEAFKGGEEGKKEVLDAITYYGAECRRDVAVVVWDTGAISALNRVIKEGSPTVQKEAQEKLKDAKEKANRG